LFKASFGRILLSLSIIAGALLPVAPGVIGAANANDLPALTPTFGARVADYYAQVLSIKLQIMMLPIPGLFLQL
jgi:hypothetical protein